ncbi:MAG TPA: oxidoreductase, partial [Microbacterium sp.]|nr:oxidoreductase [Microbacterium sp.]
MAGRSRYALAAAAGIAAVVLGAGIGELTAAIGASASSPFAAIGGTLIDAAPPWAKDVAIGLFGTGDKAALLTGIAIVLLVVAAAAGMLEAGFPPVGRVVCLLLGVVGVIAALHRPDADSLAWAPSTASGVLAALAIG